MALAATMVFEVRTTGSDANGGGFNAARGGTDYSQQNTAQATGTVTSATTTVTATTGIFTAAMVGNVITDGTVFKEITAFTSSTIVTVDSAPSWTGATINVGGAMATPGLAAAVAQVQGQDIWQQTGSYTITTSTPGASGPVSLATGVTLQGYAVTRGDLGTPPTVSAGAVGSINIFRVQDGGSGPPSSMVINVIADGNSQASVVGFLKGGTYGGGSWYLCQAKNCTTGFSGGGIAVGCQTSSCTTGFGSLQNAIACIATGGTTGFVVVQGTGGSLVACVASSQSGNGYQLGYNNAMVNCVAYKCGGDGFSEASLNFALTAFVNCVAYGVTGTGFKLSTTGGGLGLFSNTAAGGNGTNYSVTPPNRFNAVTLTADPFTNGTGGDFSLNATAGGGALLRGAGFPGAMPAGVTTGHIDLSAFQHLDSGGSTVLQNMLGA